MSRGPDVATLVERALLADAARCGLAATVTAANLTRWASATFAGARHRLTLTGSVDDRVKAWLDGLPEANLPLRGHLIADVVVEASSRDGEGWSAAIEVLTVEEV